MALRLFCCLFFLLIGTSFAKAGKAAAEAPLDSTHLTIRKFDKQALAEYAADSDFNYGEVQQNVTPSWWLRFWSWFWGLFSDVKFDPSRGKQWYVVGKYLLIALCAGVVVFAIFRILGMNFRHIFSRKPQTIDLPFTEGMENIHEISFDDELNNALGSKNYRLAVRLLYLKSLKALNDAGKIKWEINKTNSQYVNEINHPEQKKQFRVLTTQFEYVWYGGFDLNEQSFAKIKDAFGNFKAVVR